MFDHLMFCRIGSCLMIMWLISASGEMSCPELPPVDNSIFIAKEEEGQIWGTYLCTEGYHLLGQETFWCNNSKEWDAFTPECRLGHCPDPVLANGEFNSSGLVNVRDKVTFKCNEHYILKGSNWSECLGDHTWGPPLPICKSRDCDPPGKLAHGYFEGEFTSGSVVTYFCKERAYRTDAFLGYGMIKQGSPLPPPAKTERKHVDSGFSTRCFAHGFVPMSQHLQGNFIAL
ncbi:C4b-binding protein beta chain isoform X3 [Dipodomys merriami]|uniref:C4b-binding protein beta chain isoform X3 n=1 Tax=Dipodomys merriami TaxID=94247 RepID=UPI0038558BBF